MGAIWFRRANLVGTLNEMVGYKPGASLNTEQMADIAKEHADELVGDEDQDVRIRSEEFEELLASLLYGVGNVTNLSIAPIGVTLFHEVKGDPVRLRLFMAIAHMFSQRLHALARPGEPYVGPPPVTSSLSFADAVQRMTVLGINMANPAVLKLNRREFVATARKHYDGEGARLAEALVSTFVS